MSDNLPTEKEGFWERVGAAVGIGSAEIGLALETTHRPAAFYGGQEIFGRVLLRGGNVEQIGEVRATVEERWVTIIYAGKSAIPVTQTRRYAEQLLFPARRVTADSENEAIPFSLRLPDTDLTLAHEWYVVAAFAAQGAISVRRAEEKFALLPPRPILGLMSALHDAVTGLSGEIVQAGAVTNNRNEYLCPFLPSSALRDQIDGLRLRVRLDRNKDLVEGLLDVNPQEHSFLEHLQALIGANNQSHFISFSASALAQGAALKDIGEAEPDPEIVRALRLLLNPVLG